MFGTRTLAAGTSYWSQCGAGVLSKLRKLVASGAATDRTTAENASAVAGSEAAVAAQTTIDFFVGVAPSYERAGDELSPAFLFSSRFIF